MLPEKFVFWLDHNLPKVLAAFIYNEYQLSAKSLLDLGFETQADEFIYAKAIEYSSNIVIITKDKDFVQLLQHKGAPPKIIWITIGNCTNDQIKDLFIKHFSTAVTQLLTNDLVEISNSI
jgi:predicted nuclease of predicted toxin-antitoxin system